MKNELHHPVTKVLAKFILGMCSHPGQCRITEKPGINALDIIVMPHTADLPILVGKNGRQIRGLQFLAERCGDRHGIDIQLRLDESYVGEREDKGFTQKVEFDTGKFLTFFNDLLAACFVEPPEYEHERRADKTIIRLVDVPANDVPLVMAIGDVMYPYGFRQGMLLDVKAKGHRFVKA